MLSFTCFYLNQVCNAVNMHCGLQEQENNKFSLPQRVYKDKNKSTGQQFRQEELSISVGKELKMKMGRKGVEQSTC